MVPTELLHEILLFLLNDTNIPIPLVSLEGFEVPIKSWGLISAFSLCSKKFRALALEEWFWTFHAKHPDDLLERNLIFPEIRTSWTRELHCVLNEDWQRSVWSIDGFKHLYKIRLDIRLADGSQILTSDFMLPFSSLSLSSITELDLRGCSWPSPHVTQGIAKTFPSLVTLRMRQQKIWCTMCHTCDIPQFKEPGPDFILYNDVRGLPRHYSQALSTLCCLRAIHFTVGSLRSGRTVLRTGDANNDILWSGECDSCVNLLCQDDTFRHQWVSKKQFFVDDPQNQKPSRLERVEWLFWPLTDEDIHDD